MGRGYRAAHKYLLKVGEGAKAKYAYTPAEVDALMGRGRQAASDAAKKVGQTANNAAKKGREALSTASSKARDYSSRTASALSRHGSETLKTVKDYANRAVDNVKDTAKKTSDTIRDKAGYDEFERYEKAWDRTSAAKDRQAANPNSASAQREVEKAEAAEAKAHEDYLKTPLGRLNDAKSRVSETIEQINDTSSNAKYVEYDEHDSDFDDKNYTEDRRVGDTDFFIFKNNKGQTVLLEEDMKWILPANVDPNSSEVKTIIEKAYDIDAGSNKAWIKKVTKYLDNAIDSIDSEDNDKTVKKNKKK